MPSEKPKTFEVKLVQRVAILHTTDALLIRNPKDEVEQSLKNEDYFRAVTYLAAVLKYYGHQGIGQAG